MFVIFRLLLFFICSPHPSPRPLLTPSLPTRCSSDLRRRLPLRAGFRLRAGLRPRRRKGNTAFPLTGAGDGQEAFGIAEEGREARADLADDPGAEGGGIVLLARRAGDAVAAGAEHDRDAVEEADLILDVNAQLLQIGRAHV